MSMVVLILFKK